MIAPLRQQLKAGQRLLVVQAWKQARNNNKHAGVDTHQLHEALMMTEARDFDNALAEPFVAKAGCWALCRSSGVGDPVLQAAQSRGHAVARAGPVSCSAAPVRPYFLLLRAAGPSPLLNFVKPAARHDNRQKQLEAEAACVQQALAHWRSGRHFLMELLRGASPGRTLQGQELLDEPGLFHFRRDGCGYLTSSAKVAAAFQGGPFGWSGSGGASWHGGAVRGGSDD